MINVKRRSSLQCQYLASQFAESLLISAANEGFEQVPSSVLGQLVGIKLQRDIDYDIESTLALFPVKDVNSAQSDIVHHNARYLCSLFSLEPAMNSVIELIIVRNINPGFAELLDLISDYESEVLALTLEDMSGLDKEDIRKQLEVLEMHRLIDMPVLQLPQYLQIPRPFRQLLVSKKLTSREAFLQPIMKPSPKAQFTLKQFEHVNVGLVSRYLKAAAAQQVSGVNILLYGDAGTGKTELARTLAKFLRRNLLEVLSVSLEDGKLSDGFMSKEPTSLRLGYLQMMQGLLKGSDQSLFLIDECESVFEYADKHYSKEAIMRLLETNPIPTIWITNHVDMLEPSYLRRFKLVMEIPVPDESFAFEMNKRILKSLKVSDAFRLEIASRSNAAPAYIANAAHVASTLALTGEQAEEVVLNVIEATLDACGEDPPPLKYQGQLIFDPSCLNLKAMDTQDAQSIIADIDTAIANSLPIRVLLNGPPGTGKTGWVHHLAETHGIEVMHIKCSDVLSKYVGESEQNISALFREAHKTKKLMLFDEVDSLLSKRESAQAQYEVQLINELLSQLECNTQPVFAATNNIAAIDNAVMRRFDFKLTCDYLTQSQCHTLYRQVLGLTKLTRKEEDQLNPLQQLTPGDFAILARRMLFQPNLNHRTAAIALLAEENNRKHVVRSIGFTR
jgi:transitional endoplasmic reticulum ATPase